MSLKDALREAGRAREESSGIEVHTESSNAVYTSRTTADHVTITIRVPKAHRQHWQIEAKRQDTTITSAITEALNARFGQPK